MRLARFFDAVHPHHVLDWRPFKLQKPFEFPLIDATCLSSFSEEPMNVFFLVGRYTSITL